MNYWKNYFSFFHLRILFGFFFSANLTTKLAQYVELLKESRNFNGNISPEIKKRLNALLCNLVNQTTYHRNIVEGE